MPDSIYNDSRLKDKEFIYGPKAKFVASNHIEGTFCTREKVSEEREVLNFHFMPPSFTCILKVKSRSYVKRAVQKLNNMNLDPRLHSLYQSVPESGLNHVLFRCEPEERDISQGKRGPYGLENYG